MEHISRLTTNNIDSLVAISDPTHRGIQAASRIFNLVDELTLNISRKSLIVNRAREEQRGAIEEAVKKYEMELVGIVPEDPMVQEFDLKGRATLELGAESIALKASYAIFETLF